MIQCEKFIAEFPSKPDLGEATGACVSQPYSLRWPAEVTSDRRVGTFSTRCSSVKRSGSGVHLFQLAFEHTEGILNTYFSYVWYLYRRTRYTSTVICLCGCLYWTFCFGGDLTKPSITIASVDRFCLNLVIYLQVDIALLIQNSVKIWHCLSELWQCIQGVTFFLDTVYIRPSVD